MEASKGDWVRIHRILMKAGQRASQVPEDTANVPLEMWDKGFLLNEKADLGDEVLIKTIIGREVLGTLIEINPAYAHSFGNCIPEILQIDRDLKALMQEVGK
ncbi:MAG: 2-amino-4-oxopentanoate thiolase subunit OrtA [Spirochaetia bacterium]